MDRQPPQPVRDNAASRMSSAGKEQRWLIDNIIRANGIDWDQPRSLYLQRRRAASRPMPISPRIRQRVQKMADIGPAFEATARRREAKARAAEEADELRHRARQLLHGGDPLGRGAMALSTRTTRRTSPTTRRSANATRNYARLADHRVEAVWIPFKDSALPAWFHLPPDYAGGRTAGGDRRSPAWTASRKCSVALYGDRWLNRGIAVLAIDGPGQYEAPMVGINVSMENWIAAGQRAGRLARRAAGDRSRRASASPARASARSSARSSPPTSRASAPAR